MEQALSIEHTRTEESESSRSQMDTTFVLFFLAMDIGTSAQSIGFDLMFSGITLATFAAGPYLLPFSGEKPVFASWLYGRVFIAIAAVMSGLCLRMSLGTVLPEAFRFLPMTLLIVSGIFCMFMQTYGIIKFRLAR